MSETLRRDLLVDEFFAPFSERELGQEAIVNCVYAREFPSSRAARPDGVLQPRFADDDRVDGELLRTVCADLAISPAAIDAVPW